MESTEELLGRTRSRISALKARRGKSWQEVFAKCDKDQSGYLDYKEFSGAIRTTLEIPENVVRNYELVVLFDKLDNDRSGGVSIEELLNYLQQGFRTPAEIASRTQVRIQRVRKNLKMAFQTLASNEAAIRKLFSSQDLDDDNALSLYEFKGFVRTRLNLSFWDVCNTDLEDFFNYLDKDRSGSIQVDEFISFVRSNHLERPSVFSFAAEGSSSPKDLARRGTKMKTYKQHLLEDCHRSASLPILSRMPYTPSVVSRGRDYAPASRNALRHSAQMFFNNGRRRSSDD